MRNKASQLSEQETAPQSPVRILIVAPSMDILGGQAVQAARLVARLRQDPSFEVAFLPINPRLPGPLRTLQAIKYVRTVLTSLLYVATLLARVPGYDVIHVFSASYFSFVLAPTPAMLIGKLFGRRVLLNYHSGEAEDHLRRWPSAIITMRLADKVVVPSEYLVRVLAGFGVEAHAINNLIELETFKFRDRKQLSPKFLSNRNLETHYGVDCVLRAFAAIQKRRPDAELIVAGDGSQRASLEAVAEQLGLRNTEFTGRVEPETIFAQYDAADVYLNGSRIDNQPLSILEAFACGLPVVTTDAGGITDMVTDGVSAFVVQKDDHDAMAKQALRALDDPHYTNRIARRALEECQKYSWDAVGEQWTELYRHMALSQPHQIARARSSSRLQKLRRMSLPEVRVRTAQLFHKFAERKGWSRDSHLLSDDGLLMRLSKDQKAFDSIEQVYDHFRQRERPHFFPSFRDKESTVASLRRNWPEAETQTIYAADRIVSGRFDLLGHRGLSFGSPINWHLEPLAGRVAPLAHWSEIDYLNPDLCGDKKIVWELNRHQYFVRLGQAYWLTKDERYSRCFVEHLESWMEANPPKLGINWASSLEIAFRSIAWLWGLQFFKNSPSVTPAILARTLKFLYLNARHLENYLSTYFSPNTHLTGEALGLFYLGTVLPEFRDAKRWRDTGSKILVNQLRHQVRQDGVYFEHSSYYHRYTVDFYTHFVLLSRLHEQPLPNIVEEKLKLLIDHLMYITQPDGTTPLFGDDDGGRLIPLDSRRANDFRSALSTGAALFNRGDYKFVAGGPAEETLWLLGGDGLANFENLTSETPAAQSRAFTDSGFVVMRDGWNKDANYLLFDCGPHGAKNAGHAHADALAIQVSADGVAVLEDPGTYTYTGSQKERDIFRGSTAHNVLLVDGEPSSVPAGPFSWESTANSTASSWISVRRFDFVEGQHDGYRRLPDPVIHTRSVLFLKNDYWLIRDRVAAADSHQLDLRFHFASQCDPQLHEPVQHSSPQMLKTQGLHTTQLALATFGEGTWRREEGWVSHCYGERTSAPVWTFSAVSKKDTELVTLLLPHAGDAADLAMREVEAIGGRAFEIVNGDWRDVVLIRDPRARRIQTIHLVSDFKWTWARFSPGSTELPEELLVLDGRTLELNGKQILMSAKSISYLVANRSGHKFRLETSEGNLDFSFPIVDLESLFANSEQQERLGR